MAGIIAACPPDLALRQVTPGSESASRSAWSCCSSVLILPLPTLLLDLGLALSITASVLVLMVALFLTGRSTSPAFPTLLLLTTLLRLSLNVATTRLILSHGNEGPLAAGHVVAAFGGFLMGGDVVIGLIVFVDPAGGELHGHHQGLRPHRRGRRAVQPGRDARQADGDRRRPLRRADRREGGAPPPPRTGGGKRLLRRHGRRGEVRPRRRHRGADHHRDQHRWRPGHRPAAARHGVRRRGRHLHHADRRRWSGQRRSRRCWSPPPPASWSPRAAWRAPPMPP